MSRQNNGAGNRKESFDLAKFQKIREKRNAHGTPRGKIILKSYDNIAHELHTVFELRVKRIMDLERLAVLESRKSPKSQ